MSQKKFDHQPPTYTYFLNISKKEEKKHRMSSAGKKIVDSLTFLLFKEKKNVFFHPNHHLHQFFSLFKKWKKRKNKHIIQEDARPFQKNKSKN